MATRISVWRWVSFVLSALIALTALRFFVLTPTQAAGDDFGPHLARLGLPFYAHAGGGAVALLAGALQWITTTGARRSRWHSLIGRTYVVAIGVSGLAGLTIAVQARGGIVARTGFAVLAVVWLTTTGLAFARARARHWDDHRRWMIRSFSLTFAAVTLRIWLPLLSAAGVEFEPAYPFVAWVCWVPNLAAAEWWIGNAGTPRSPRWYRRAAARSPRRAVSAEGPASS